MMSDVQHHNPHDRFFKAALGFRDTASKLLAEILPDEIMALVDLRHLRIEHGSYVDPPLRDLYTDALFTVPFRDGGEIGLYMLIEHFSDVVMDTVRRLAGYIMRAHDDRTSRRLPPAPILAAVVYHGERPWTAPMDMRDWQNPPAAIRDRVLSMPYTLYNLRDLADDQLPADPFLRSVAFAMKYVHSPRLAEYLPRIMAYLRQGDGEEFLDAMAWYLLGFLQDDVVLLDVTYETFGEKGGEAVISAADKLRKEGEARGEARGVAVGTRQLVLRLLARQVGFISASEREELEQLPLAKLDSLADDLLDFREPADLTRWLATH